MGASVGSEASPATRATPIFRAVWSRFRSRTRVSELRVLAQQGVPPEKVLEGWLWFGGLALTLLICFVVAVYVYRRVRGVRRREAVAVFDLDELRQMRDTGELTIQEYDTLRQRSITEMGLAKARAAHATGSESGGEPESMDA